GQRHTAAGAPRLLAATVGEVMGVADGGFGSPVRVVKGLVLGFAGDAMVLDTGVLADAFGVAERFEVIRIEIVAYVAVVFTIIGIGRIADAGAPDQLGGHGVSAEGSDAGGAPDGGMDAERRRWLGVLDTVAIHQEIADAGLRQHFIESRIEGAFG